MLDQLMQLIQQSGQQSVVENQEVPNAQNGEVLNEAQNSIFRGLQELQTSGQMNNLLEAFQNDPNALQNNTSVQNISNQFVGNLTEKLGISKATAGSIAASIIPAVLGKILGGNNQQQKDGFDLGGLLSSLTGNSANPTGNSGLMGTINSIGTKLGLDKDGDGDVDMNDLSKLIR